MKPLAAAAAAWLLPLLVLANAPRSLQIPSLKTIPSAWRTLQAGPPPHQRELEVARRAVLAGRCGTAGLCCCRSLHSLCRQSPLGLCFFRSLHVYAGKPSLISLTRWDACWLGYWTLTHPHAPLPPLAAYFAAREKQLVCQSILAAAKGSSAWRASACGSSSELLRRRGRGPLLVRIPRRMTGVHEADSRVFYICCVAVPCSSPQPAPTAACSAAAAPALGYDPAVAAPLQRAASAPLGTSQCTALGLPEQPAVERLGTPPVAAEHLPAAKRSRHHVPAGLPPANGLAAQGLDAAPPLDCPTSSPCLALRSCCSLAPQLGTAALQPLLAAGPAVQPLRPAGRSEGAAGSLDRLMARMRSLLSSPAPTCPPSVC